MSVSSHFLHIRRHVCGYQSESLNSASLSVVLLSSLLAILHGKVKAKNLENWNFHGHP